MATYNFTIRATDSAGVYSDRAFSIVVNNTSIDRFIVVGSGGIVRSPDAITWTYDSYPKGHGVLYGNGKWLVWGMNSGSATTPTSTFFGNWFYSSTDGVNWSLYSATGLPASASFPGWATIKFRNNKFMGFTRGVNNGSNVPAEYWESTDGVTWTKISSLPAMGGLNGNEGAIDFEYYNGTWLVLVNIYGGTTTTVKVLYRSTNGTSWTQVGITSAAQISTDWNRAGGVVNVNGLWMVLYGCVIGSSAQDQPKQWGLQISSDGITWESKLFQTTTPASTGYAYATGLSYNNGRIFFYSNTNSAHFYATSPRAGDTNSWTTVSTGGFAANQGYTGAFPPGGYAYGTYGNRTVFIAAAQTTGTFYVSPNFGTTWTATTPTASLGNVFCVGVRNS